MGLFPTAKQTACKLANKAVGTATVAGTLLIATEKRVHRHALSL